MIINQPYTVNFKDLPMDVHIHELEEGLSKINNEGSIVNLNEETDINEHFLTITTKFLIHASPCLGYRIHIDNKIITYGTDTGICPELIELALNADLLIIECSFKFGQKMKNGPISTPKML